MYQYVKKGLNSKLWHTAYKLYADCQGQGSKQYPKRSTDSRWESETGVTSTAFKWPIQQMLTYMRVRLG